MSFPYYLSEQTRVLLISAAYLHLKKTDFSKFTRNPSPASPAILLSGPAELYQQMLAKALAHYFEAKLVLFDVSEFSQKIQSKYGSSSKDTSFRRSISEAALEGLSSLLGSLSILPQPEQPKGSLHRQSSGLEIGSRGSESSTSSPKLRRHASVSTDMSNIMSQSPPVNPASVKRTSSWSFDEKLLMQSLYKNPEYRNGKLISSSNSLSHGFSLFQEKKLTGKSTQKMNADNELVKEKGSKEYLAATNLRQKSAHQKKASEVAPDDEFEERIRLVKCGGYRYYSSNTSEWIIPRLQPALLLKDQ
ncbi:hypothetical protein J5N97_007639 [Dioscorea zingiberensis]|uniref:DUF7751 domain-containing protein n=1 Tax=Dioscorea zingiberensis TaxID=325984 RepID=A0A9D5HUP9_9LILI|nr:hypothetical protein J5N97_007639 [Dioscorea zingiberensis]